MSQKQSLARQLQEVTRAFRACCKPISQKDHDFLKNNYFKTAYQVRNVDKDKWRATLRTGFSFSDQPIAQQAKIYDYIFKNTDELALGSLSIDYFKSFQNRKTHPMRQHWPVLKTWVGTVENWVHGDMLAGVYCQILAEDPGIYSELKKWAAQREPWWRRMALISMLYYYHPKRGALPFSKIINLVEPQLTVDHYYLQKAVGWCLRELGRAHPAQTRNWLEKNHLKLSAPAYTTAVEKIEKPLKDRFKEARKQDRQSKRQKLRSKPQPKRTQPKKK